LRKSSDKYYVRIEGITKGGRFKMVHEVNGK
jgi:hypothetical protein